MDIVQWCNNNEGFISAILSILTLIISIIAIYSSIKLAFLPYKKSILINPVYGIREDKYYLELNVANSGNKLIGISYITIKYKDTYIGGNDEQKFIAPSKTKRFFIDMELKYEDVKFDKNPKVKIEICDTERKEYKFKSGLAMG